LALGRRARQFTGEKKRSLLIFFKKKEGFLVRSGFFVKGCAAGTRGERDEARRGKGSLSYDKKRGEGNHPKGSPPLQEENLSPLTDDKKRNRNKYAKRELQIHFSERKMLRGN